MCHSFVYISRIVGLCGACVSIIFIHSNFCSFMKLFASMRKHFHFVKQSEIDVESRYKCFFLPWTCLTIENWIIRWALSHLTANSCTYILLISKLRHEFPIKKKLFISLYSIVFSTNTINCLDKICFGSCARHGIIFFYRAEEFTHSYIYIYSSTELIRFHMVPDITIEIGLTS